MESQRTCWSPRTTDRRPPQPTQPTVLWLGGPQTPGAFFLSACDCQSCTIHMGGTRTGRFVAMHRGNEGGIHPLCQGLVSPRTLFSKTNSRFIHELTRTTIALDLWLTPQGRNHQSASHSPSNALPRPHDPAQPGELHLPPSPWSTHGTSPTLSSHKHRNALGCGGVLGGGVSVWGCPSIRCRRGAMTTSGRGRGCCEFC